MQRTERSRIVFVLLLSLVGTAALFLPFIEDVSPWLAVSRPPFLSRWWIFLLGAPCFLTIPNFIWQARKLFAKQLSIVELTAAYVLSAAAMLSVIAGTVMVLAEQGWKVFLDITFIVPASACWLLAVVIPFLLWRNLRNRVSREAVAETFLLGGYLPNAVFCLIAFGWNGGLQIGAHLIAAVSIGYLAAIVLLSRQKPSATHGVVEVPT